MSGLMAKRKGANAEREVCSILQPIVTKVYASKGLEPPVMERNLMQSRNGGFDIVGIGWLALEIKRHETLQINQWWDQTKRQAKQGQLPVLLYRQNRVKWRCMMFGLLAIAPDKRIKCPVDVSLEAFLIFFETKLVHQLEVENVK